MLKFVSLILFLSLFCFGNSDVIKNEKILSREYSNSGYHDQHHEQQHDNDDNDEEEKDFFFFQYIDATCPKIIGSNTGLLNQKVLVCNGASTTKTVTIKFTYKLHNSTLLGNSFLMGNCSNEQCQLTLLSGECSTILNNIFYSCNSSSCSLGTRVETLSSVVGMLRRHRELHIETSKCSNLTREGLGGGIFPDGFGSLSFQTCAPLVCNYDEVSIGVFDTSCENGNYDVYRVPQDYNIRIARVSDPSSSDFLYNVSVCTANSILDNNRTHNFTLSTVALSPFTFCPDGVLLALNRRIEILNTNVENGDLVYSSSNESVVVSGTLGKAMNIVNTCIYAQISYKYLIADPSELLGCAFKTKVCVVVESWIDAQLNGSVQPGHFCVEKGNSLCITTNT